MSESVQKLEGLDIFADLIEQVVIELDGGERHQFEHHLDFLDGGKELGLVPLDPQEVQHKQVHDEGDGRKNNAHLVVVHLQRN